MKKHQRELLLFSLLEVMYFRLRIMKFYWLQSFE